MSTMELRGIPSQEMTRNERIAMSEYIASEIRNKYRTSGPVLLRNILREMSGVQSRAGAEIIEAIDFGEERGWFSIDESLRTLSVK